MHHDVALAAQYLDPRFRSGLNIVKQQKAKILNRILNDRKCNSLPNDTDPSKDYDLLDAFFSEQSSDNRERHSQIDLIMENFHRLDMENRPPWQNFNIISYWKANKAKYLQILELYEAS